MKIIGHKFSYKSSPSILGDILGYFRKSINYYGYFSGNFLKLLGYFYSNIWSQLTYLSCTPILMHNYSFFVGQPGHFLFIFFFFNVFYRKCCRLERDSNCYHQSRRRTCLPLDHHHISMHDLSLYHTDKFIQWSVNW